MPNVGDMKNMGLEFNLNFIPIEKEGYALDY